MYALRMNGDYCFSDEERVRIEQVATDVLATIKAKGLTFAEAFEALEQCKSLIDMSPIKVGGEAEA